MIDIRAAAARYYDMQPIPFEDISFYKAHLPSPQASVLELGCGTGRVLLPLAAHCRYIHGLDASEAMLAICRAKMEKAGLGLEKVCVQVADITAVDLDRKFDLIIAPYRVFQNLESDESVAGFFETVRKHLAPVGVCILNVFHPNRDPDGIVERSANNRETVTWESPTERGRVVCFESFRRPALRSVDRLVIYPRLRYREHRGDELVSEAVLDIAMRVYYPEEFEVLIERHGFRVLDRWGGYAGEVYGQGPELVVKLADSG